MRPETPLTASWTSIALAALAGRSSTGVGALGWFRAEAMAGVEVAGRKQSVPLRPPYKPFKEALRLKVVMVPFRSEKSLKGPYESLGDA